MVPYDAYVQASALHRMQHPLSSDPGEMSFLMVSQIMELYFGLTCHELRETQRLIRADQIWEALAPLRRAKLHLEGLNAAWQGLRWMSPADFNRFRNLLGEASGFQSAMYRQLEFLLGLRDPTLIRPFRRQTDVYAELTRRAGHAEPLGRCARAARPARLRPARRPARPGRGRSSTSRTRRSRRPGYGSTTTAARTTTCGCSARR